MVIRATNQEPEMVFISRHGPWRVTDQGVQFVETDPNGDVGDVVPVTECPLWVVAVQKRRRAWDQPSATMLVLFWKSVYGRDEMALLSAEHLNNRRAFVRWSSDHFLYPFIFRGQLKKAVMYINDMAAELTRQGHVSEH